MAEDAQIEQLRDSVANNWGHLDIVVHSMAFAPRDQLEGTFLDAVNKDGFLTAHEISSYSFSALAQHLSPLMDNRAGAFLTLTYIGALRSMPGYNVMGLAKASLEANVRYCAQSLGPKGIRVNAVSAGPIRTLAASGIRGMKSMIDYYEKLSPLGRSVSTEEVGNAAAFPVFRSGIGNHRRDIVCGWGVQPRRTERSGFVDKSYNSSSLISISTPSLNCATKFSNSPAPNRSLIRFLMLSRSLFTRR